MKLGQDGKSADEESDENIGKIFRGKHGSRYRIEKKIGSGGIGTVYQVHPESNDAQKYALKTVKNKENISKEKEVLEIASSKSYSIHLCKIVDSGEEHGQHFIVFDLLGKDLSDFIKDTECSTKIKYKLAEQCLIAIEALHGLGYIHRDIKPDNFALGRKGSEKENVVFIIDFGMCCKLDEKMQKIVEGTSAYGSTTAAKKKELVGRKHDLESWFYMIAEWFIGNLPWEKSPDESVKLKEKLRDETSKCFKDFFGEEYEKLPVEFVKILRYIDNLQTYEKPNYNRIIYFLQQAYQNERNYRHRQNARNNIEDLYMGPMTRGDSEKHVGRDTQFRLYHRTPSEASQHLDYLKDHISLYVVYKSTQSDYHHYPIQRCRGPDDAKQYYIDCGENDRMVFNTLDALITYYSVYVRFDTNDETAEVFPSKHRIRERKSGRDVESTRKEDDEAESKTYRKREKRKKKQTEIYY
uniref:Protein kinase domain-containing protein n=1 Tax=Panagrolaimus davidi TaxID=227884 RepID=A0A914QMP8_9BILA